MQRIVILVSGRGSNMQALVQACRAERWPAEVVAVLGNRPQAPGLAAAAALGLPVACIDHTGFASREAFDATLAERIELLRPTLVLLAGFMRVLGDAFVQRFAGRLLNIHPSLLPAFAGLHTHRRALEAGCTVAGATVHYVTPQLDHGPIVAQAVVPVLPTDDEARLAARVQAAEHRLYPLAARWFVQGRLRLQGQRVLQLDGEPQQLLVPA